MKVIPRFLKLCVGALLAGLVTVAHSGVVPLDFETHTDDYDYVSQQMLNELKASLGRSAEVRQTRGRERYVRIIVHTLPPSQDNQIAYAVVWLAMGPQGEQCQQGCYLNSIVGRAGNLVADRAGQRIASDTLGIIRAISQHFP
ncbi:hypothetical protein GCM10025770_38380 [Viridibacterium curvum]|uniref:Uncharacterized protein n=1 Tax=Viridibacterium curvum TaxID=1101404 RepID=A0ABP9R6P8_9RHOO